MSSCQDDHDRIVAQREQDVYDKAKGFLKHVVNNLCIPEGMTGQFDIAFKIDRQKIIARVLEDLGKELAEGNPIEVEEEWTS